METKAIMDWLWRGVTAVLIPLVVSLGGWVWNMQTTVTNLKNDLGDAEDVIEQLQSSRVQARAVNDDVIGMKKDIEYMKKALDRIEKAVQ